MINSCDVKTEQKNTHRSGRWSSRFCPLPAPFPLCKVPLHALLRSAPVDIEPAPLRFPLRSRSALMFSLAIANSLPCVHLTEAIARSLRMKSFNLEVYVWKLAIRPISVLYLFVYCFILFYGPRCINLPQTTFFPMELMKARFMHSCSFEE